VELTATSLECLSFEAATTGVAGAGIDGVRGVELPSGTFGVGVAFVVAFAVAFVVFGDDVAASTAAWMAVLICCSVTLPRRVPPPCMTIVGVPFTPFDCAIRSPGDVLTLYSMSFTPVCAVAFSTSGFTCSQTEQ
jgi:hypothetical protein